LGAYTNEWGYWPNTSGTSIAYWRNSGSTVYTDLPRAVQNDVMMFALDIDNGKIYAGINGVWFKSGNPAAGTNALSTNIPTNGTPVFPHFMQYDSGGIALNFGQRAWAYAPPAGFNALTTKNLPRLAVGSAAATPNQFFDAVTYTGNGTNSPNALTVSSLNFQPDLIWIKNRGTTDGHWIQDTVRGLGSALQSNTTGIDLVTGGGDVSSVTSTGFVISYANSRTNASTNTYVAWCWRAGGAAVSNTSGTITSQVSANTASGFSIATWTGSNANGATIGHGLTTAPSMFIIKPRNATTGWYTWHTGLTGSTYGLSLNAVDTQAVFTYGTATAGATTITAVSGANGLANINATSTNYVGYFWTEVPGFSKFGTFTANANTDGPFIYCGFKPRFVLGKDVTSATTNNWFIFDTARDTYNGGNSNLLRPNLTDAELANANRIDILSNGFKVRGTALPNNVAGDNYIFMAFAEKPFGNVNGTAR